MFSLEKEALKNHPRLYLYHQILISGTKIFNISQNDDFTQQNKTSLKRNTKDIILGGWIVKKKYSFDAKFEGNILVVGKTGCGKTTFVQNLGKNKIFQEIKEVNWISKIPLSREKEKKLVIVLEMSTLTLNIHILVKILMIY